jgi:polygalacturonase
MGKPTILLLIQKANDECSKNGGQSNFSGRHFICQAPWYLKSNTTLHLSAGRTLLGSADLKAYPYLDAGIRFMGDHVGETKPDFLS